MPPVYWAGRAQPADDPLAYAVLSHPDFDPDHEVLLAPAPGITPAPGSSGRVSIVESRADRAAFDTDADGPGFLVVLGAYDPGWRAAVDGRSAPVLRANVLFQAVAVPGGRHRVELRYRPPVVAWGLGLSAAGALLLATLLLSTVRPISIVA